ncbi:MAG: rRNA maturation RNase YbeY [Bacteroidales bacterium]|jgi:rRNA maturation RNase YbeY|nr:rRNA maturation RNase YbeY [Bacteroidales bacterium]
MTQKISFTNLEVRHVLAKKKEIRKWFHYCTRYEGKIIAELAYNFCTDEFLLNMNKQYLKKDYYTDIITFDYSRQGEIKGDIFISIERVEENAKEYGVSVFNELLRVMIHGILHLCGYKDDTEKGRQQMRRKENKFLEVFYSSKFIIK